MAIDDTLLVDLLSHIHDYESIPILAHEKLWQRLKHYFLTGGLPEVVSVYVQHKDDLFTAFEVVRQKQRDLIEGYFADIAKHSGKINAMHIHRIWQSVPEQLARSQDGSANKFKFKQVVPGIDRYSRLSDAIDWLESAGLILKTSIVNSGKLPLKAYVKKNTFKLYMFDVGILGALNDLNPKTILDYNYGSYKGFYAENFVAQALLCADARKLYSWEERTAEVEFLQDINGEVIPIEIKSGWVTQAKSLKVFAQKYEPPCRVTMSAKNLNVDAKNKRVSLPLYLAGVFDLSNIN